MKLDPDIIYASIIALLMLGVTLLIADVRDLKIQAKELQTQIDELKIVVDQKFLPAMIFDKENLHVR